MRRAKTVFVVITVVALISGLWAVPVQAVFGVSQWPEYSAIESGDTSKGYALVEISGPVYDRALPDLRDLRVVRVSGEDFAEITYDVVGKTDISKEKQFTTTLINRGTNGKKSTATIDLGTAGGLHNHLRVNTGSRNFIKDVTLEGSNDRTVWVSVKNSGRIADVNTEGQTFHRTEITYDTVDYRYLRVTLAAGTGDAVEISGIDVLYTDPESENERKTDLKITGQDVSARDKTSVITLTSGYDKLPVHRLQLTVNSVNFSRLATVYGSADQKEWQRVGEGTLTAVSLAGYRESQLSLPVDTTGFRYLRVIIRNGDSAPLKILKAEGFSYPSYALFPCQSGGQYRLYYGNRDAKYPDYDLAAFSGKVMDTAPPVWSLLTPQTNPFYKANTGVVPESEKHKWLLPGILVLLVAGLGVFILRAVPKVMKD